MEEERKANRMFNMNKFAFGLVVPSRFKDFREKYAGKRVLLIKTQDGFALKPITNEIAIITLYKVSGKKGGVIFQIPKKIVQRYKMGLMYEVEEKDGVLYYHEVKQQ